MDTRKKPKKSKPKPKPKGKPVRPTVLNQPNPAIFKKYTRRGGGKSEIQIDLIPTHDIQVGGVGGTCPGQTVQCVGREECSVDTLCTTTVLRTHQER